MQVGDLVKFNDERLPYVLGPSNAKHYKGKIGIIIEAKGKHKEITPYTLFKIHIDGANLEWFVWHELDLVCK
tara:strand:- start:35 stop:250 length:216 start_codon:yes stop_codon:yes gene_type:complete